MVTQLLLVSAFVALAACHPVAVDYDDLGVGLHLADSPGSNGPNNGIKYDTGIFDRYADDKHELEYVPPAVGELPFEGLREKRDITPGVEINELTVSPNFDLFASLHDYIRPERDAESNDTDIEVPLHGLVHAIETTLLNSAGNIKSVPNDTHVLNGTPQDNLTDDRIERSIEVFNTAKTDDIDEYTDKDLKMDVVDDDEPEYRGQSLGLLSPIAFSPSIKDREAAAATSAENAASAETTDSTEPRSFHRTNITVIKSSNSTDVIPRGEVYHVQQQHIQHSVFHSNLAILPTIPPSEVNVPLPSKTPEGGSGEEDSNSNESSGCSSSSEESGEGKTKCNRPEATTENREALKEELARKAQKLKEQVAEIAAEPVILSQGI